VVVLRRGQCGEESDACGDAADADECAGVSSHAQRQTRADDCGPGRERQDRNAASGGGDSVSSEETTIDIERRRLLLCVVRAAEDSKTPFLSIPCT